MASLGMGSKSYVLSYDAINEGVTRTSPGNYALGYEDNEKLHNKIHPARPRESNWKCPVCDVFD